ncbi:unnamed protein product [Polarella glacialis]|uniref:Uncharacterized protein n=1 Tax=Polarella glacialis TaxID=89957 RepID=A0A813HUI4_POLGL|nr:unnamed protein product [Polarella glacialis]
MGASASAVPGGSWLFTAVETGQIVVTLNDIRSVEIFPGEELSASVRLSPEWSKGTRLTRDRPTVLSFAADTTLLIEFKGLCDGPQDRFLGEIKLPLAHVARRCGGSLYHTWLPISPQSTASSSSAAAGDKSFSLEYFDRALRAAARDPRQPMACLSLCRKSPDKEIGKELVFQLDAAPSEKAARFEGLLQSHTQHARMLQALYRHVRTFSTAQSSAPGMSPGMSPNFKDALQDSFAMDKSRREGPTSTYAMDLGSHVEVLGNLQPADEAPDASSLETELARLREEIETTTQEANARINQAGEAIILLKDLAVFRRIFLLFVLLILVLE